MTHQRGEFVFSDGYRTGELDVYVLDVYVLEIRRGGLNDFSGFTTLPQEAAGRVVTEDLGCELVLGDGRRIPVLFSNVEVMSGHARFVRGS